jgi:hypothetical protein
MSLQRRPMSPHDEQEGDSMKRVLQLAVMVLVAAIMVGCRGGVDVG